MTDPIADFLTRIKNAYLAHHRRVKIPYSKTKHAIAQILAQHQYIGEVKTEGQKPTQKLLVITLRYSQKKPAITHIKRISKPGVRIYARKHKLPRPLSNYGIAIISTSQGLVDHKQAQKQGLGGEILCEVW
jgi:small subunit ribosomal protein S8